MKRWFSRGRGVRREEGMALIFALGFLALMLILGLGFVTTSLLAQRLAANNSNRVQARTLARSAAARACASILLYNDQVLVSGSDKTIENYDFICSYGEVEYNKSGATDSGALNDQLVGSPAKKNYDPSNPDDADAKTADESKLKYQVGTEDYTGENSQAKWMYFYDAPSGTDGRRIIGRAAFQVLPRQAGRLSLYAITGGSRVSGDFWQYPHKFRWGRDIAELDLTNTTTLRNWYDVVTADNIPSKYEDLYSSSAYNVFFSTDADAKKKWIEYWFAEGKNPILKDAFPTLDSTDAKGRKLIYINRFNISDYYYPHTDGDNWYDRFKSNGARKNGWDEVTEERKNSKEALDTFTGAAVAYKENHTTDPEVEPSGLPFLRRIGNDKGSFESLELLRRQIAANFNDYCDADAVPTSDVAAKTWGIGKEDPKPLYTGNERTLYINEVALKLSNVNASLSANNSLANGSFSGTNQSNVEITSITPTLIAELVNMYDKDFGSGESDDAAAKAAKALLDPACYEFLTALNKLTFEMKLKVTFKFKYQYHLVRNSDNTTVQANIESDELEAVVDYDKGAVVKVSFAPGSPAEKTVSAFGALSEDGYSVGSVALDNIEGASITQDGNKQIFADAITDKKNTDLDTHSTADRTAKFDKYVKIEVSAVKIRIEGGDPKVEFLPFLLKVKSTAAGVDSLDVKGRGVDFVRMDATGEMTIKVPDTEQGESPVESGEVTPSGNTFTVTDFAAFIGGIEARDPRQNLNPNYSDPAKSDWNLLPKFVKGGDISGTDPDVSLSMAVSANTVTGGKRNRYANPAEPKYLNGEGTATAVTDVDKETATDPAWKGDSAGDHVSTAYIRNKPMVSPWEIGLIHRGREWQTLNIKRAGGFGSTSEIRLQDIESEYKDWTAAGTSYQNGDGAILEFVKVGINCRCMGKVPLTLLRPAVIQSGGSDYNDVKEEYNKDIIRMLFDGIRRGQTMKQFYAETNFPKNRAEAEAKPTQGGSAVTIDGTRIDGFVDEVRRLCELTGDNEFRLRTQFLNSDYGAASVDATQFTFNIAQTDNDAQREEIIGKTINLLTVNEVTPPNVFRVIVVAQSIKDVGGIGSDITISKIHNGNDESLKCRMGQFDFISDPNNWENNTYFDEIIGEVKALVTIERVPATNDQGQKNKDYGRMVVTGIEFID